MKLNEEQIVHIENYITSFNIKYYEIYMEILDHMILSVETILLENKAISFEDAVVKAKVEGFGKKGFRGMMNEKIELLNKSYRKNYTNYVKGYFKLPQLLTTLVGFVVCLGFVSFFKNPLGVVAIIMGGLIGCVIVDWIRKYMKYGKKNEFKVLKMTVFGYYANAVFMWLYFSNFLVSFASDYLGNSILLKLFASSVFTMCFVSFLIYLKISIKTTNDVESEIFA